MNLITKSLKNWYYDSRIYLKYGTARPEEVELPATERTLCIDPDDRRARKNLIINSGLRRRTLRNQRFWQTAIQQFQPQTALDIGFNYGECMLSTTYHPDIHLFAFEANHGLKPFIQESLKEHPNQKNIECLFNLVGDRVEEKNSWIDTEWSGCSSAAQPDDADLPKYKKQSADCITIDHALNSRDCQQERLFFKLDVEGYEYRVLQGMLETLHATPNVIGFVEFDSTLLRRAGEDVSEYWNFLRQHFEVYAFEKNEQWRSFQHFEMEDLEFLCGEKIHTDLVLIKSDDPCELNSQLTSAWQQIDSQQFAA